MRYSREVAYALIVVSIGCVLFGAPPWLLAISGLTTVLFGYLGLRQGKEARDEDDENADHL